MLAHLKKYARISPAFTVRGNSNGYLEDFYAHHIGEFNVEPIYTNCLSRKSARRYITEIPREEWRILHWKQTWKEIYTSIFDPWDNLYAFLCPYVFFSHLRYLINRSVHDPHSALSLPLGYDCDYVQAFLKLDGMEPVQVCISGDFRIPKWQIDLRSWDGHPTIWRERDRILIPALRGG
ncbi:MAG: hypothetical protein ACKKL4_01995 [Patescibacteria group bacterium]